MSPLEAAQQHLAQQQLWAAWVSAGAAVVQALGAALAIFWTVKLAREADARTMRLENAAVEREKAAELASVARAEQAEKASREREEANARTAINQPIDLVLALATAMLRDIDEQIETARIRFPSSHHGMISGGYDSDRSSELRDAIQRSVNQTTDPDLVIAYNELAKRAARWNSGALAAGPYIDAFQAFRDKLADAANALGSFRRE